MVQEEAGHGRRMEGTDRRCSLEWGGHQDVERPFGSGCPRMAERGSIVKLTAEMLSTARLCLYALSPDDSEAFFPILKDPAIYQFIPDQAPVSPEALRHQFERYARGPRTAVPEVWLNWGVFVDKQPIGTLQATISVPTASAQIAYVFGMAYRHRGLASESVFTMTQWLFAQSLDVVTAVIDTRNEDSIRLVKRLGFRQEAQVFDADFFKGHPSHEIIFACRRPDLVNHGYA